MKMIIDFSSQNFDLLKKLRRNTLSAPDTPMVEGLPPATHALAHAPLFLYVLMTSGYCEQSSATAKLIVTYQRK
jgi:hypothetical protein